MPQSVQKKNLLQTGVVDIHTHILPGLDDGAPDISVTEQMLQLSCRQGVRAVIATPHYVQYHWRTTPEDVKSSMEKMVKRVILEKYNLHIYSGQEIQYFDDMVTMLQEGKLLTLAGSRYVLTEFLPSSPWSQIQGAVRKLTLAGYYPVLAHIERYQCLRRWERLDVLQREGAYLQMNYGSLIDRTHWWDFQGRADRRWCRRTLLAGYISFLGTDMHDVRHRPPNSEQALAWIRKKGGDALARRLSMENPEKIVTGERL